MRSLLVLGLVGLLAQLVDGSLGMAYGVTSSIIAFPGGVGAFAGATFLSNIDGDTAKPWVAVLLLSLGVYVIYRFLVLGGRRPEFTGRLSATFLAPLGIVAGLMDAIGGGGWGPVGTTPLLSSGRLEPRKVVGSIDTSEFVVALGGSLGFLLALGSQQIPWSVALALLTGGVIAAPFAAWLVKHLAPRVLGVAAGGLIILTNTKTILEALGATGSMVAVATAALFLVWVTLIAWAVTQERLSRRLDEELETVVA